MSGKTCSKCNEFKDLDAFHIDNSRKDGKTSACALCRTKHSIQWASKNKSWRHDSVRRSQRKRNQKPEVKKTNSAQARKWQNGNPEVFVPYNRARASVARVKRFYPDQLKDSLSDILCVYQEAYTKEQQTGSKYFVDHRRPLIAGGLHCKENLQVLDEEQHQIKTAEEILLIRTLMCNHYESIK